MKASDIAQFLDTTLLGRDIEIDGFAELSDIKPHKILFAKKFTPETAQRLSNCADIVAIVPADYLNQLTCSHIISDNPRLAFMRVLSHFFAPRQAPSGIHPSAIVEQGAVIGNEVTIGANCYIGSNVTIGDHTWIHPNVVIDNIVDIGEHCEIKSGAVIGQEGFGFERSDEGIPIHFPHFGKVKIGNNVFIGSNTTIERATLGTTIIEDNVKIDDLVQIGHNSHIGANSMITVGALICGGAVLHENSYIAPNASIKEKLSVGVNGFVGLGAVVIRDVYDEEVVVGNPARALRSNSHTDSSENH